MPKIQFAGDPPRMDFALYKLHTGVNLVDLPTKQTHSLGEGELTKLVSDAGNSLRRTLDATLETMKPGQSLRVVVSVLPTAGFQYAPSYGAYDSPGFGDQLSFMFGNSDQKGTIIKTAKSNIGQNEANEVKKIIVLGHGTVENNTNIRHPQTNNEDDGAGIVDLQ